MAKFKLDPDPTFKAIVPIPVHGKGVTNVEFIFKHRTSEEFDKFIEELRNKKDPEVALEIACGWELADPFDTASIEKMFRNYMGSAKALIETYIKELTAARLGN